MVMFAGQTAPADVITIVVTFDPVVQVPLGPLGALALSEPHANISPPTATAAIALSTLAPRTALGTLAPRTAPSTRAPITSAPRTQHLSPRILACTLPGSTTAPAG